MKKFNKSLVMAVLTLVLSLSLITGATFALFQSESKTNIAVTSGKLDVVATVEEATMSSSLGAALGKAEVDGNEVVLSGFVPGDKATFTIEIENKSDISALYRTMVKVEDDNGLFDGLVVIIGEQTFNGFTAVSKWEAVSFAKKVVQVSIELPAGSGNEYQGKSAKLVYIVEAVQSNAGMTDADVNDVEIYTAFDLIHLSRLVNEQNKNQAGKTVKLMNDIDMKNRELVAIGSILNMNTEFAGTFDGQGHSIKNVNIISRDDYGTGLFGSKGTQSTAVVKNFTMDGGTVTGPKNVAPVFGMAYNATIEGITVKNITVRQTGEKRASGLVANSVGAGMIIKNNHVENVDVIGTSDLGELFGNAGAGLEQEDNTFENVSLLTDVHLSVSTDAELLAALNRDEEFITITMTQDLSVNVSNAYIKFGSAKTRRITVDGQGHKLTFETTYWSQVNTLNPKAVMAFENMELTSSQATGTWDSYDVHFLNKVELTNVDVLKSLALSNDAILKDVTITESHAYYALWIVAVGQTVEIDGLVVNAPAGRAIAIKDEYVAEAKSVTLSVKNAKFTTLNKAAILVTSTAGAKISLENVDISKVAADTTNHVWVDKSRVASYNFVIVTGGSKIQEKYID